MADVASKLVGAITVLGEYDEQRPADLVVPPQAKNPEIPPALEFLIVCLLAKKPVNRPASAGDVLASLRRLESPGRPLGSFRDLPLLDRTVRGRLVGREQELRDVPELWK